MADGGKEVAIGEGGAVEVWALGRCEETAEGGEGEARLAGGEGAEDDGLAEPEIGVRVVGFLAEASAPQAPQAIARGVEEPGRMVSSELRMVWISICRSRFAGWWIWWVEEVAFFCAEEEETAVDEAEELLEVVFFGEGAVVELLAEGDVVGVCEEAFTENEEGFGDAGAEAIADAEALGMAFGFPLLPNACLRRRMGNGEWRMGGLTCAGGVEDAPEGGEVGVAVFAFAEDGFEVELEEIGSCEGFGVAEEAEPAAVGDDGPEGMALCVEEFLSELVGGFPTGS